VTDERRVLTSAAPFGSGRLFSETRCDVTDAFDLDERDAPTETDSRFPSGPWTGFFLQPALHAGRVPMSLTLVFRDGRVDGDGSDCVGDFTVNGHYDLSSGEVTLLKQYVRQHAVEYRGFNEEGKGIWGVWRIRFFMRGGFHIWPEGMDDPTQPKLRAEEDVPHEAAVLV